MVEFWAETQANNTKIERTNKRKILNDSIEGWVKWQIVMLMLTNWIFDCKVNFYWELSCQGEKLWG